MIIQLPAKEKLYLIKHGTGICLNVVFSVKGWGIGLGLLHNVHSLFKRPRHPLHFNLSVAKKIVQPRIVLTNHLFTMFHAKLPRLILSAGSLIDLAASFTR